MADFIIIDGDQATFDKDFGAASVAVRDATIRGSGPATHHKNVCVVGDEKTVVVPNCAYQTLAYANPGLGTLRIAALASDQQATKTRTGGKLVLLKGSNFTAKFEVQQPASQPGTPPTMDPATEYSGTGHFITHNKTLRGT